MDDLFIKARCELNLKGKSRHYRQGTEGEKGKLEHDGDYQCIFGSNSSTFLI